MSERRAGDPVVLVAAGFAAGLIAGLLASVVAQQGRQLARRTRWRLDRARTITYDENLPDQLERREVMGQPRYGGTGALGVSPAAPRGSR